MPRGFVLNEGERGYAIKRNKGIERRCYVDKRKLL